MCNDIGGALLINTTLATVVKNEPNGISARINGRARIFTVSNAANLYLHVDTLKESRLLYQTLWDSSVAAFGPAGTPQSSG
jgi:hypothetical protein